MKDSDSRMDTTGDATDSRTAPTVVDDSDDGGLGEALLQRFLKGVREDGWKVRVLGSARAMSVGKAQLGGVDQERAIVLVAERPAVIRVERAKSK